MERLPDTEVLRIDIEESVSIPADRWRLVNRVLGYPDAWSSGGDFWDILVDATPSLRGDGSVMRSAPFPRPVRDLQRLVPSADPARVYTGRLTLVMSSNAWRPANILREAKEKQAYAGGFMRTRATPSKAAAPCRVRLYFEDLRALPPACCGSAAAAEPSLWTVWAERARAAIASGIAAFESR